MDKAEMSPAETMRVTWGWTDCFGRGGKGRGGEGRGEREKRSGRAQLVVPSQQSSGLKQEQEKHEAQRLGDLGSPDW